MPYCIGMTDQTLFCDPCYHQGKTTSADIWCHDCEERFCQECVKVHKIAKQLRHHNLVPIHDIGKDTSTIVTHVCEEHGKKIMFYCPQHDDLICYKCIQSCHVSCDVTELEDAAKGIKSSNALTDIEETVSNILQNIKECNNVCIENEKSLVKDEEISEDRKKVNAIFDILEEKLTQKLDSKISSSQGQIQDFKAKLENVELKLKQVTQHIATFTVSSELQMFVGLRMIQKSIDIEETVIKDLMTKVVPFRVKFLANQKLQFFIKQFDTLGKIKSEKDLQSLEFVDFKCRQAQHLSSSSTKTFHNSLCPLSLTESLQAPDHSYDSTSQVRMHTTENCEIRPPCDISKIHLTLRTKIQVESGYFDMMLTSCIILPNKQLMFADAQNKRLIIYNPDGSSDHYIKLTDQPFDVAVLNEENVVVTYKFDNYRAHIEIVNIYSYKQSNFVMDKKVQAYWGISHSDENAIFVVAFPLGIQRIDIVTKQVTTVPVFTTNVFNIAIHDSKLYYTNKDKDCLYCSDLSGKIIWQVQNRQMRCLNNSSINITVDETGNVYVAGMLRNIVMVISKDGKSQRIILDESNQLDKPRCVYYDKTNKQLLVCNQENGLASLYDVKW